MPFSNDLLTIATGGLFSGSQVVQLPPPLTPADYQWLTLGVVTPRLDEWVDFPLEAAIDSQTFRFTPGNLQGKSGYPWFQTYALVRLAWEDGASTNHTSPRRVYPRNEAVVIDLPIPGELLEVGGISGTVQVLKLAYRGYRGHSIEPAWTLKCDDYARI